MCCFFRIWIIDHNVCYRNEVANMFVSAMLPDASENKHEECTTMCVTNFSTGSLLIKHMNGKPHEFVGHRLFKL